MNCKGVFSRESDLWCTPIDLFNSLNDEFHFDLDPCTLNNNLGTKYFFTPSDDGLTKSWDGLTVFVNPPYSDIKRWVKKCFDEYKRGSFVVLLIPSRTDTSYFHDYILPYAELRFIKGRLKFSNSKNSAPFPSVICVFRPEWYYYDFILELPI